MALQSQLAHLIQATRDAWKAATKEREEPEVLEAKEYSETNKMIAVASGHFRVFGENSPRREFLTVTMEVYAKRPE